ncbi:MAG: hypothetical protein MJZ91_10575 [Bacteroidales bacterium]|nr:hypothetical protein [Bacteroidales bacterium]
MKHVERFLGTITACSHVVTFVSRRGAVNRKIVLHIVSAEGAERAITASGDLANWVGFEGRLVEVEYVNRVFPCAYKGCEWFGNELYAVQIRFV